MLSQLLLSSAAMGYGLFNLIFFTTLAILDGSVFRPRTKKEQEELSSAQNKIWNIKEHPFGLHHQFFTTSQGVKLHYVTTHLTSADPISEEKGTTNLVIFIHGFPDSWFLWNQFLRRKKLDTVFVALDLPGYGGSDSLPKYDAEHVLECVTAFVIGIREQYDVEKVLIVSHDWGAIVTARLAAEAPQLADRFVISSAFVPALFTSNFSARFATTSRLLSTWTHQPTSFRLIIRAMSNLSPVISQLRKSGYIFLSNLPMPLAGFFGTLGNYWFLRVLHRVAAHSKHPLEGTQSAEAMASATGPSLAECTADGYPEAVKKRSNDAGWSEKIRFYREGLLRGEWKKSLETLVALQNLPTLSKSSRSNSGAGLLEDGPKGALKTRATLVYGMKDIAFESRVTLNGVADYLAGDSQVVVLEKGGHWLPLEKEGGAVLEEIVTWWLDDEKGTLKERLNGYQDVKMLVER